MVGLSAGDLAEDSVLDVVRGWRQTAIGQGTGVGDDEQKAIQDSALKLYSMRRLLLTASPRESKRKSSEGTLLAWL